MNIENLTVNTLRMLSVDQVQRANSGHPGLPLGAAPAAYTIFAKAMNHNPKDPNWINRDRFILSAGHGSSLLYSLLHVFGYGLTIEDLKNFRQVGSKTPGHPEFGHTVGVECSTGPLGQGLATAVGFAMAERHLAALYNEEEKIIDHYTYVLCGDGDLQEGITNEASSLAGTLKLNKLIVLYDSNKITIEGSTDLAFTENVSERYKALNWNTLTVKDGNDVEEIYAAIKEAKKSDKPTIIEVKTQIGYGSPRVGLAKAHGEPLGEENVLKTREFYKFGKEEFFVPEEVKAHVEELQKEFEKKYEAWKEVEKTYSKNHPDKYKELIKAFKNKGIVNEIDLFKEIGEEIFTKDKATRASSGEVLNFIAKRNKTFFGGSADLGPSNKSTIGGYESFSSKNYNGGNIHFGIREMAMAAIGNGILLHGGLRSFVATFMVFSDYLKPSLRMSALMNLPALYILTHDSIGVGEDGPTHQPVEQLTMLRTTPNTIVFRPADTTEVIAGYQVFLNSTHTPVALALSRQTLKNLEGSSKDALKGGYIIKKEKGDLDGIIIATGSEVALAIEASDALERENIYTRVVSMPSTNLFEAQPAAYQEEVLPKEVTKRLSVEAGSTLMWGKYVGLRGKTLGIDTFGESGKADEVFKAFGITADNIVKTYKEIK